MLQSKEDVIKKDIFPVIKQWVNALLRKDANCMEDARLNIELFAKKFGITDIQRVPPEIRIDGKVVPIKHAVLIGTVIFLNVNDNPEKQRFSIAHEMYHLFTRRPDQDNLALAVARQGEAWKKQNAGSADVVEETIADYFAANLLVPAEQFILWEDRTDEEIAHIFGVEPKCVKKRREKEIEGELCEMAPKGLASSVALGDLIPLSDRELDDALEGYVAGTAGSP